MPVPMRPESFYFGLRKINMKEEMLILATVMEMLVHCSTTYCLGLGPVVKQ